MRKPATTCPCGSVRDYAMCCRPYHEGASAADAEILMRSRYCAYVLDLDEYVLRTWHPSRRPQAIDADPLVRWLGLSVQRHEQTALDGAIVEFVARYRVAGASAVRLHEISRFVREDGRWYYVDGDFSDAGDRADNG